MSIVVTGADQTSAKLARLQRELDHLPGVAQVGQDLIGTARTLVRRRTGRLAASLRLRVAGNTATLTAGGLPYVTVQEFGGYHNITPNRFIRGAADKQRNGAAARTLSRNIAQLVRSTGL